MIKDRLTDFIRRTKKKTIYRIIPGKGWRKKSVYSDLAPNDNLSETQECMEALDWAINNPKIKNIAITGPYGSGKSSVIASYCKLHPECRPINISLATFAGDKWEKLYNADNEGNQTTAKDLEEELEKGILKQLFYKINADKIPLSKHRKLHHIKLYRYILGVLATFAVAWAMVSLFFPETVIALMGNYWQRPHSLLEACVFAGTLIVLLLGISCFLRFITTKFTIKEIGVGDAKIQGEEKDKESTLNKNMDEMLYFFERTKYETVFIEDLDRFNTTAIFTKLREINRILNQYEVIKRRIVFVYAVKDDLFQEVTDRTKFFDFIIPIVPYINTTNSEEIMRTYLGVGEGRVPNREYPEHHVSEDFITLVSPYIGDMRVLLSIINEFWIYKRTLFQGAKAELSDNRMLALIIYKNIYPKDFALLEAEAGSVKEAFRHKLDAVKAAREELEKRREQLQTAQSDCLKSVREIKQVILSEILNNNGFITQISVAGKTYKHSQLLEDNFSFDELKQEKLTVYYVNTANYYEQSMSVNKLEEYSPVFHELFSRYDAQCALKDKQKEKSLEEFEKIDREIIRLQEKTLQQLINVYSAERVLPKAVQDNELLVLLLRHGYIREDYAEYINYFRSGSISDAEQKFILSVRNHKGMDDFSYTLQHCENICERMLNYEFEQPEVLNFSLLDYLLESQNDSDRQKCERFLEQITNGSTQSRNFVKSYIERNVKTEMFLQRICHESGHVWKDIVQDEQLSADAKANYFALILNSCNVEDICRNDFRDKETDRGEIRKYFESDKDILGKLSAIPIPKMMEIISALQIRFVDLNTEGLDGELVDFILEGKYYILNHEMMAAIFRAKAPNCLEKLFRANYHCVRNLECKAVLDYIYEDFAGYVQDFVLGADNNTEEEKEDVDDMISRLFYISEDMCVQVIEKEHMAYWVKLSDCLLNYTRDCDKKTVWDCVLQNGRTDVSWDNYVTYHKVFGLTPILLKYADNNMQALVKTQTDSNPTDDILSELLLSSLSNNSFKQLIESYPEHKITNKLADFSPDKLNILIDVGYLPFAAKTYLELREIAAELGEKFALKNRAEFFESLDECQIGICEVTAYIGHNDFNQMEIKALLECIVPEDVDEALAQQLRNLNFTVPKKYAEAAWKALREEEKYQLLYRQLEVYTLDELAQKFSELGGVYRQFAERTKHKYSLYADEAGFNKGLCTKLLKIGFLSSCDEVEEKVDWPNSRLEKRIVGYVKKKPEPKHRVVTV